MRILRVLALLVLVAVRVEGHHSFAAYYFEDQSVTIEGDIVEVDYRAPHAWVYVMAPDASGQMQRYGAEWANPQRLMRDGVTREKLQPGDRVLITGSPGRTASEYKIHLKRIQRPADGWAWGGNRGGGRQGGGGRRR